MKVTAFIRKTSAKNNVTDLAHVLKKNPVTTGGMINVFLWKKKKEKKQEQAVPVVNKEELIAKASEKVTELESKTGDERVSLLNEIGSLYTQAEETDLAIQYYEESLELCKQHGKASTDLMKLYNKKRQEAAEAKDDEKVKEYMDKVQNLMQMSKDMIRGNA